MMFMPIIIPMFSDLGRGGSFVKSGEKYTVEWWQNQLEFDTIATKVAAHLIMMERQGIIKKIKRKEYDIPKFKPIKYSNEDIIEKLTEKCLKGVDK